MKKLLFLLPLFLLVFGACSKSDDDNNNIKGASFVKATINGVEKTFNTVSVVPDTEENYEAYKVTASINNNPNETITFYIMTEDPTSSYYFLYNFNYFKNNTNYTINSQGEGNVVITYFDSKTYKGNFYINLSSNNNGAEAKITNGSFEIYY